MGHVAALDGLRGLAVAAVVLYHLPATWLPGGFLGVDVFFVLSGFLITSLLLREQVTRGGHLALRSFWARRVRRLLPAALTVIMATTLLAPLVAGDAMDRLRGDVPAALAYVLNWRLVFHHDSYAQVFGRPPLLEHLWSLGIEEQFYLAWPLVMLGAAWWGRRRDRGLGRTVGAAAAAGALASGVAMAALVRPGHDPSAVYFDPFTHASGLLLGAATAAFFPLWRRSGAIRPGARRILEMLAGVAAAGMVVLLLTLHQTNPGSYRGGIQLAALLSALIVLVAGHPGTRLGRPLGCRPLVWLGRRSYSLYLWHWPLFEMTRPGLDIHLAAPLALGLRLGVAVLAADLTYRFVEQPWRSGRAQRALRGWWRQADLRVSALGAAAATVLVAGVAAVLAVAGAAPGLKVSATPASRVVLAPLPAPPSARSGAASTAGPVAPAAQPSARYAVSTAPGGSPAVHGRAGLASGPDGASGPARSIIPPPTGAVVAIGDSVLLGASSEVGAALGPGTVVDAAVGRQVSQGLARLAQYRAAGRLAGLRAVVVALGTNGPMSAAQCHQFVDLAGRDRVVFVNVRVPRPWQDTTNASIAACAQGNPTAVAADWYGASEVAGVIGPDQVHETVAGRYLYASVVAAAVDHR